MQSVTLYQITEAYSRRRKRNFAADHRRGQNTSVTRLVPIVSNELIAVDCCRYTDLISRRNLVIQPDHVAAAAQFYALFPANAFLQRDEEFDGRARLD